jgi:predicted class III extradiol MEMO1 family dioxygenase
LSLIFGESIKNTQQTEKGQQKFFAILPHFTLQPKTIENFYTVLKETYGIKNQESINIVLISPDHFNTSKNNIDMLCNDTEKFCYKENCISAKALLPTKTS